MGLARPGYRHHALLPSEGHLPCAAGSFPELTDPLLMAWMNQRLDPDVRATVLSMTGQAEAVGQVGGGLLIGLLAGAFSVPLALLCCGALLIPALGLVRRANRYAA